MEFGAPFKELMFLLAAFAAGGETSKADENVDQAVPSRPAIVQQQSTYSQSAFVLAQPVIQTKPAQTIAPKKALPAIKPSIAVATEQTDSAQNYDLALGHNHTCKLEDGDVNCWGSSYYGQTEVPAALGIVQDIAAADQNTCALESDQLTCWGIDGDYTLPLRSGKQVSTGGFHVCAIDADGLWCDRGGNEFGELNIPADLKAPTQVAAGTTHTCALGDGEVHCWGSNDFGEADVPALDNPTQIAAGGWYNCAIDGDEVKCWGNNDFGQLDVPALVEPIAVMAGHNHACAIDRYGLQCWGRNAFGQADVPSLINPAVAQPGTHHSCATEDDGNTVCWGYNAQGQATPKT